MIAVQSPSLDRATLRLAAKIVAKVSGADPKVVRLTIQVSPSAEDEITSIPGFVASHGAPGEIGRFENFTVVLRDIDSVTDDDELEHIVEIDEGHSIVVRTNCPI